VDSDGRFTTPLLPEDPQVSPRSYGVNEAELHQRQALRARLLRILSEGDALAEPAPAEASAALATRGAGEEAEWVPRRPPAEPAPVAGAQRDKAASGRQVAAVQEQKLAQAAFDRLSEAPSRLRLSKEEGLAGNEGADGPRLDDAFETDRAELQEMRPMPRTQGSAEFGKARREQHLAVEPAVDAEGATGVPMDIGDRAAPAQRVRIFESALDPFEFGPVGADHFVLYRKVWREGQRHIQGAVIDKTAMLSGLVEMPYRETPLAGVTRLGVVLDGETLLALGGQQGRADLAGTTELSDTPLYRARLSSPLDRLELVLSVTRLPLGAAGRLVIWVALTLGLVISAGLLLMYRLGLRQIALNRQQRDFVSAVSHELKTPLTSIRMYSELLREGWADEARRHSYYEFIHDESERLSRLITNVLQLARMSRGELRVETRPVAVTELMDLVRSKVATQVAHAGFALEIASSDAVADKQVLVDDDAFAQIMINLVDNALKFSARADERRIAIGATGAAEGLVDFFVRDHGPGIPRDQLRKIFRLFYRSENELTRETVGTGIGLALVHRLTTAMGGEVDVVNREPGAEFRVRLPIAEGLPRQGKQRSG
jgi:signal transduction histidine kinase